LIVSDEALRNVWCPVRGADRDATRDPRLASVRPIGRAPAPETLMMLKRFWRTGFSKHPFSPTIKLSLSWRKSDFTEALRFGKLFGMQDDLEEIAPAPVGLHISAPGHARKIQTSNESGERTCPYTQLLLLFKD
jgi:hypothetical protein